MRQDLLDSIPDWQLAPADFNDQLPGERMQLIAGQRKCRFCQSHSLLDRRRRGRIHALNIVEALCRSRTPVQLQSLVAAEIASGGQMVIAEIRHNSWSIMGPMRGGGPARVRR